MNFWDKIKQAFADAGYEDVLPADLPIVGAMTAYKLKDGTEILIEKLEAGGKVMKADQTPVGAGSWELEDGSVLTTDEAGVILTYTPMQAASPPPDFDAQAQYTSLADKFAAHEQAFAAMQQQAARNEAMLKTTLETIQLMAQAFETLGKKPQTELPEQVQLKTQFSRTDARKEATKKMLDAARQMQASAQQN